MTQNATRKASRAKAAPERKAAAKAKKAAAKKPTAPEKPTDAEFAAFGARAGIAASLTDLLGMARMTDTQVGNDIAAGVNARLNVLCPIPVVQKVAAWQQHQQAKQAKQAAEGSAD